MSVRETLSELALFQGIDRESIEHVVEFSCSKHCPPNYLVFNEGDLLKHLYVVEQGVVKITVNVRRWPEQNIVKTAIKTIQAGEVFGWAAVLDPPRTLTSAHALPKTTLIAVDGAKLREILVKESLLAYNMMAELFQSEIERVHVTNHAIVMEWEINAANS